MLNKMRIIAISLVLLTIVNLGLLVGFNLVTIVEAQTPNDLKVEIYIPQEMEKFISVDVVRDYSETQNVKYLIKRRTPPEVNKVKIFVITPNDKHGMIITTSRDYPDASVSAASINHIIIIIMRVETDEGAWIIDSLDEAKTIQEAVEKNDPKLIHSYFKPKQLKPTYVISVRSSTGSKIYAQLFKYAEGISEQNRSSLAAESSPIRYSIDANNHVSAKFYAEDNAWLTCQIFYEYLNEGKQIDFKEGEMIEFKLNPYVVKK